jgi:hypothetical protein
MKKIAQKHTAPLKKWKKPEVKLLEIKQLFTAGVDSLGEDQTSS